jgi:hypothetical protein
MKHDLDHLVAAELYYGCTSTLGRFRRSAKQPTDHASNVRREANLSIVAFGSGAN